MALTTAELNAAATAAAARLVYMSLHAADPSTTGANEVTGNGYTRVATTPGSASGGVVTFGDIDFAGPANGDAKFLGYWSAITAGTFRGGKALTGDQALNAAGAYTVTGATVTATSS